MGQISHKDIPFGLYVVTTARQELVFHLMNGLISNPKQLETKNHPLGLRDGVSNKDSNVLFDYGLSTAF